MVCSFSFPLIFHFTRNAKKGNDSLVLALLPLKMRLLVAGKQGHCAEKASAGKEIHPEMPPCFRRARRAIRRPVFGELSRAAGRPYNGITLFLGKERLARPTQKMNRALWFFRGMTLLPGRAMLDFLKNLEFVPGGEKMISFQRLKGGMSCEPT
jgi:hypothetical protein